LLRDPSVEGSVIEPFTSSSQCGPWICAAADWRLIFSG
jgi:hypothetical protein